MAGHMRSAVVVLIALGFFAATPEAWAQYYPSSSGLSGTQSLQQRVREAQDQLRKAQAEIDRLTARAKARLAEDPDWSRAQAAADDAKKHRDTVKEQCLSTVRASTEYLQASQQLATAEADLARMRDLQIAGREVDTATNAAIDARIKISTLQRDALAKSSEVIGADANLAAATSELDRRWDEYQKTVLAADPSWVAAMSHKDAAKAAVEAAESDLAAARHQQMLQAPNRPTAARTPARPHNSSSSGLSVSSRSYHSSSGGGTGRHY